jgi:hypothetical protein
VEVVEKERQMNSLQVISPSYKTSTRHYSLSVRFLMCIIGFSPGYDFLNTNINGLEMNIWYNSTYNNNTAYVPIALLRVPRLVNMVHF